MSHRTRRLMLALLAVTLLRSEVTGAAPGDSGRRSEVAFDYGLSVALLQVRDDLLRPLRWTGPVAGVALGLDAIEPNARHRVDLGLGLGLLWNRYGHEGVVLWQGAHYQYLRRATPTAPVGIWVGAAYRYESIDTVYADWDDSFMYWLTTHTLAPAVAFDASLSPTSDLVVSVELPMLGVASRPPKERLYKVDPLSQVWRWPSLTHRSAEVAGPADLFAPTLTAAYVKRFGPHFGMRVAGDLVYRHSMEPETFQALAERVTVELRHAF